MVLMVSSEKMRPLFPMGREKETTNTTKFGGDTPHFCTATILWMCPVCPVEMSRLVALYRAMRLRFGYGFESCDANGPRNVKNTNIAKHRPIFLPPLLLVGSKELVLKVPKRGQFHAAIRMTRKRCDSCAQVALGTRTVSRRNF